MKKQALRLVAFIFLLQTLAFTAFAQEKPQRVFDYAGLFTQQQTDALERQIAELVEATQVDAAVLTIDDSGGKSAAEYADDFYDQNGFGIGPDYSGALLLIDMDNREVYASTAGQVIPILYPRVLDAILDEIIDDIADKDYAGAARIFLLRMKTRVLSYRMQLEDGAGVASSSQPSTSQPPEQPPAQAPTQTPTPTPPATQNTDVKKEPQPVLFAFFALLGSSVICGIIAARYKMAFSSGSYPFQQKGGLQLTQNQDVFAGSSVSTQIIQKNDNKPRSSSSGSSSSSGFSGGSTHTSSSGRTHGGGGRKF